MFDSIATKARSSPAARFLGSSVGQVRDRLVRKVKPPSIDELCGDLEVAVAMLFMGDQERLEKAICESASKEEAVRMSVALAERLITSITMVAHETEEDLFEVWSRQCRFHAEDELHEPWPA